MRKIVFSTLALLVSGVAAIAGNLFPNPEFTSKNGNWPDGWSSTARSDSKKLFKTENGIVSIEGNSPYYTNNIACKVPVDGYKSYKFSIDMKTEDVGKQAAIFYFWLTDKSEKISGKARFIIKETGSHDWKKVEAVLSPDNPAATTKLLLCLNIYRNQGGKGKVLFRNPVLTEITQQDAAEIAPKLKQKAVVKQQVPESFDDKSFSQHNFTWKERGQPYYLEKDRPGYLDFSARHKYAKPVILQTTAPSGTQLELYLYNKKSKECEYIKPAATAQAGSSEQMTFNIPTGIGWNVWGNCLFIKPSPGAPDKFSVTLKFSTPEGKLLTEYSVPAEVIPAAEKFKQPQDFHSYTWYSYPLARIDIPNTPGKLPAEVLRNWQDSGFAGGNAAVKGAENWSCYLNFTHILPFWSKDYPAMRRAVTVGGGHTDLICPSELINAGPDFFVKCVKTHNLENQMKAGKPVIVTDYEPYAGRNGWVTSSCFCPECIKNFANFAKIPSEGLDARKILTSYEKQWVQFRCMQRSQVIKAMADAIHKINPDAQFALCSMPMPGKGEDARYFKEYGIDLRMHDPVVDLHMPMNYIPTTTFFHRLERDARSLKKPAYPVFDNGWGILTGYYPERTGLQVLAAAMLGLKGHYAGRGLICMDGAWMKTFKQTMTLIADIEPFIRQSSLCDDKVIVKPGLRADGNIYSVARIDKHNRIMLLVLNNNAKETVFAGVSLRKPLEAFYTVRNIATQTVLSPDGKHNFFTGKILQGGFKVKLPPLDFVMLEITPGKNAVAQPLTSTAATDQEEKNIKSNFDKIFKPQKANGMSTRMTAEGYIVETPAQTLIIDLKNSGTAAWKQKDILLAKSIARDSFVSPALLNLTDRDTKLENCTIEDNAVNVQLAYKLADHAYAGLIIRKTYTVYRNTPRLKIEISIVPDGGYRQFRFKVCNIISIGQDKDSQKSYIDKIIYKVPFNDKIITDAKPEVAIFTRESSSFPADKPFFSNYAKPQKFKGQWCTAENSATGQKITASFSEDAAQLFLWRRSGIATIEWIYADAYPDNDPHKVKTWSTSFNLEYAPSRP